MKPLKQHDNQITLYGTLWTNLRNSLHTQFETALWYDLCDKLWDELQEETLGYILLEELEHQCL